MAPGVEFPRGAGFWFPLGVDKNVVENRRATSLQAIARARPGVSHETVAKQVGALVRRLAAEHPEAYSASQKAVMTPLIAYWSGSSRPQLRILLGASVLLLIASTISAGILILSAILARRAEIATRIALGAQARQILSQLGAEGALMAGTAGVAGAMLAAFAVRFLVRWAPADIPRTGDAGVNLDSICFSAICAVLAAVFCTLIPGIAAMRLPLESVLREGTGTRLSLSRRSLKTRNFFVLGQAAVTVAMLAIAGLFVLSYRSMISADVGFPNRDALSVNLQLRGPGLFGGKSLDPRMRRAFYPQLLKRLRESPGVISAAAVLVRPLEGVIGWDRGYEFEFEAGRRKPEVLPKANYEAISPDYFRTVGTPLLEGRDFSDHDTEKRCCDRQPQLAERISKTGYSPLGQRIRFKGSSNWLKIVGVCGNARSRNVTQEDASIFVPSLQAQDPHYLVIRGKQSVSGLSLLVRQTLAQMDPTQAVAGDARSAN
ncbi:MAG TPA: ABC transporter permease [Bryobacteraceae bacterium]|nr:ABC transporter permease [Bryobacteraceae bacterium]